MCIDWMAEREGFEPSIGLTYTPLAGERLQPLGHLSGLAYCNVKVPVVVDEIWFLSGDLC